MNFSKGNFFKMDFLTFGPRQDPKNQVFKEPIFKPLGPQERV